MVGGCWYEFQRLYGGFEKERKGESALIRLSVVWDSSV